MANVQGKFYTSETQRRGVTPSSPPNAEDDPQDPLNPPGSGGGGTTFFGVGAGLSLDTLKRVQLSKEESDAVFYVDLQEYASTDPASNSFNLFTNWDNYWNATSPYWTGFTMGNRFFVIETQEDVYQSRITSASNTGTGATSRISGAVGGDFGSVETIVSTAGTRVAMSKITDLDFEQSIVFVEGDDSMIVTDSLNSKGIEYADDYSSVGTLDPRWIPDWGAVTAAIAGGGGGIPPIDASYASQALMIADQANQTAQYIYFDGTEYWEYLGTTTPSIADYRAISAGGGGSNWTVVGSDIYRNSSVAIGRTTIPANNTFSVQSITATANHKFIQFFNNSGTEVLSQRVDGGFSVTGGVAGIQLATFNRSSGVAVFRVEDNSIEGAARLRITGDNSWFRPSVGSVILEIQTSGGTQVCSFQTTQMELQNGFNIRLQTTTGTKIGTSTTQKLSFWNKTPIIQPTTGITGATRVGGGGTTITDTDTFGGYTVAKAIAALINTGILA